MRVGVRQRELQAGEVDPSDSPVKLQRIVFGARPSIAHDLVSALDQAGADFLRTGFQPSVFRRDPPDSQNGNFHVASTYGLRERECGQY